MRSFLFVLPLLITNLLALWLLAQMIIYTSPKMSSNVVVVLFLVFVITSTLIGIISWKLIQRVWGADRYMMSLRHGVWAGIFIVTLPIFRWLEILTFLVIAGELLIIFGLESLILLQQEPPQVLTSEEE